MTTRKNLELDVDCYEKESSVIIMNDQRSFITISSLNSKVPYYI